MKCELHKNVSAGLCPVCLIDERNTLQVQLGELRQSLKGAVAEIVKLEELYEKQYWEGKRLNIHPIEYTEGLVSGYKSSWIILHAHNLIERVEFLKEDK